MHQTHFSGFTVILSKFSSRYKLLGLLALVLIVGNLAVFQVDTTQYAIVTQFGNPVRSLTSPGLYFKLPDPLQNVMKLDRRLQIHNLTETEFLTKDKKNILVEAYATWRIKDPVLFFKSVGDTDGANNRLADILTSELGVTLSQYELTNLVTTEAGSMKLSEMSEQATRQTAQKTEPYGFVVTDVRLKMLNFPKANQQSVFQRMRVERERIARQLRSEGTEAATKIRAEADAQKTTLLSEAKGQSEKIRGEGEAEAIKIYAEAFGQDSEFYKFLRTLESYNKVLNKDTTLILPGNSELLKYLNP